MLLAWRRGESCELIELHRGLRRCPLLKLDGRPRPMPSPRPKPVLKVSCSAAKVCIVRAESYERLCIAGCERACKWFSNRKQSQERSSSMSSLEVVVVAASHLEHCIAMGSKQHGSPLCFVQAHLRWMVQRQAAMDLPLSRNGEVAGTLAKFGRRGWDSETWLARAQHRLNGSMMQKIRLFMLCFASLCIVNVHSGCIEGDRDSQPA